MTDELTALLIKARKPAGYIGAVASLVVGMGLSVKHDIAIHAQETHEAIERRDLSSDRDQLLLQTIIDQNRQLIWMQRQTCRSVGKTEEQKSLCDPPPAVRVP